MGATRRVAVLVEDVYEDQELWYPVYRLREAGFEVAIVGPEKKEYRSKHGYPVTATAAASDVRAEDLAAVVVPGGYAPDRMRRDRAMVDLVRTAHERGVPVAAICHAGWMLASAGIVRGRRVTSYSSIKDDLVNAGARWEDAEVVVDGGLITSRRPDDLPAFLRAILQALGAGAPGREPAAAARG